MLKRLLPRTVQVQLLRRLFNSRAYPQDTNRLFLLLWRLRLHHPPSPT